MKWAVPRVTVEYNLNRSGGKNAWNIFHKKFNQKNFKDSFQKTNQVLRGNKELVFNSFT